MLYHKDLFVPEIVKKQLPQGKFELSYSEHAMQECQDGNGKIVPPKYLDTQYALPFEFEVNDGKLTKVLYKVGYNLVYNLIIVVIPDRFFVKTLWLNAKTDHHRTLDKSKYSWR